MDKRAIINIGFLIMLTFIIFATTIFSKQVVAPVNKMDYVKLVSNTDQCITDCETVYEIYAYQNIVKIDVINSYWKFRTNNDNTLRDASQVPELKDYSFWINDSYYKNRTCTIASQYDCGVMINGSIQYCDNITNYECGSSKEYFRIFSPYDKTINIGEKIKLKIQGKKIIASSIDNIMNIKIAGTFYSFPEFAWWNNTFNYAQCFNISNVGGQPYRMNTSINVSLDTATLISLSRMRSDCGDLRLVYNDFVEVDYVFNPPNFRGNDCNHAATTVVFKAPNETLPGTNESYCFYYNNSVATHTLTNASAFIFFDDFNRADGATVGNPIIGSTWTETEPSTSTVVISGNRMNVTRRGDNNPGFSNTFEIVYGNNLSMINYMFKYGGIGAVTDNLNFGMQDSAATLWWQNAMKAATGTGNADLTHTSQLMLLPYLSGTMNFTMSNYSMQNQRLIYYNNSASIPGQLVNADGAQFAINNVVTNINTVSASSGAGTTNPVSWTVDDLGVWLYPVNNSLVVSSFTTFIQPATATNTAPNMTLSTMPTISPTAPNSNNQLNCTFTPFDAENTTIFANITWTRAGLNNNSFDARVTCTNNTACGSSTLVSSPLQPNIAWTCTARLDEGGAGTGLNSSNFTSASVTILNTAPNVTTVAINASTAVRYDSLNCSATPRDAYNTTLTANFSWYKGGALQFITNSTCTNGTQCFTPRVMPSVNKSEVYVCGVNIFDGDAWSNETNSTSLTVSNTAPTIQNVAFVNSSIYFNTTLTVNVSYTDLDADTGTIFFNWSINSNTTLKRAVNLTSVANGTFVSDTLTEFNVTSGNNITVNVSATDSTIGTTVTAINTSVSNYVPPNVDTINIFYNRSLNVSIRNNTATTNASFNCTATYDDFENTTGYIQFSWFRNGVLIDEQSTNVTTADQGTGYSVTLGDADTTKNDIFTCRTRACDIFNSTSCSAYTNSTVNITNSAPIVQQINITNYKTLPGTNITIITRVTDLDGGADIDRYEIWFNSSNYTNNQFTVSGNNAVSSINISISQYFPAGNYTLNVTFFDDTGQILQNLININSNNQIEVYPGLSRTDPNISRQMSSSVYLGKNIVPTLQYTRQVALTNYLNTAIAVSGNTTLPSDDYVDNATISLINQTSGSINYTGIDTNGFVNYTTIVNANSTAILNLTYNLTPIVISNISSVCTLTRCDVNFTIENRHIFKIDDLDFIINDADLPYWSDRSVVQAFFNLVNGTGTGQYERRTITTIPSNFAYNQSNYTVNICTGSLCTQDDPTIPLTNLFGDTGNTTNSTGTDSDATSTNNEVSFSLGSLKVDNVDLGASSTYVLRVSYSYSTITSSSGGGGGGGGGGTVLTDQPLLLGAGNLSATIKTDRGGSVYNLYMTNDQIRQKLLLIKNTGTSEMTLGFSCEEISQGVCSWIEYNTSSLTLKANEEAEVMMTIKTPVNIANNKYKSNVLIFNNKYGLNARLPVTISISTLGSVLGYFDKFQDSFIIHGNASSGGKDINIPVFLVSILSLIIGTALLWMLFAKISITSGDAGLIAFVIAFVIAMLIPLLA